MNNIKPIWFLAMLVLLSCANIDQRLVLKKNGVNISCRLNRMKIEKVGDEHRKAFDIKTDEQTWILWENANQEPLGYERNR